MSDDDDDSDVGTKKKARSDDDSEMDGKLNNFVMMILHCYSFL